MFNHNFVCFFSDSDKTNSSLCLSNLHSSAYPSTHLSIHLSFIYVLNMHMHIWKREIALYSTCQYALLTKKIKMNEAGISKNKKILLLIPVYLWFYIYHQLFIIIWLNNSMKLDVLNWMAFILVKLIVYRTRNSISLGSPITNTLYERSFLDVYTVTCRPFKCWVIPFIALTWFLFSLTYLSLNKIKLCFLILEGRIGEWSNFFFQ